MADFDEKVGLSLADATWPAMRPAYIYRCEAYSETFERIESIAKHEIAKPPCPKCGSEKVIRVPVPFNGHHRQEELMSWCVPCRLWLVHAGP